MKLKSIHIHGFKSFADRITVDYHEGITGVIGPNGSGKSNIIDAVRWVMGEQTAKSLRADDATDIIFAGSENRKPLGMAEVSLTFSNNGSPCPPEYMHLSEISIGRRIYRDGEREYFFNKNPCRLKDIVEFLLSVGLGSKSYSIIQQEKRDRIIAAKPDEMREILEESAGISAFKQKRKEAEQRLESTAQQLKNLQDVQNELEKQSASLKEQVVKAQAKIKLTQDLRNNSIQLLKNQVGFFRSAKNRIHSEIRNEAQWVENTILQNVAWEKEANELKSTQLELQDEIRKLNSHILDKRSALARFTERLENQKRRAQERAEAQLRIESELMDERKNLQHEEDLQARMATELDQGEVSLRRLEDQLSGLEEQLEDASENLSVKRVRVDELRSEVSAIERLTSQLRTKSQGILDQVQRLSDQATKLAASQEQSQNESIHLLADERALTAELQTAHKDLQNALEEQVTLQDALGGLRHETEGLTGQRDALKARLLEVSAELSGLQKMQGNHGATRANSCGNHGAAGLAQKAVWQRLFERVDVHPDDEVVLESALADVLQARLVDDTDSFVAEMDFIEEHDPNHKHAFLLRYLLEPLGPEQKQLLDHALSFSGVRSVAHRLGSQTHAEARHFFERVIICRDEWIALKVMREAQLTADFFVLSERGSLLRTTGEVYFGQHEEEAAQTGFLKRKRQIEEHIKEQAQLQDSLAQKEGELFRLKESFEAKQARLSEISHFLSSHKMESVKKQGHLDQLQLKLRYAKETTARIEKEIKDIQSERAKLQEEFSFNQKEIDDQERERTALQQQLLDQETSLEDAMEERDVLRSRKETCREEWSRASERCSANRTRYEESTVHLTKIRQKIDRSLAQLNQLHDHAHSEEEEEGSLVIETEHLRVRLGELDNEVNKALGDEAFAAEKLRVIEGQLRSQKDAHEAKTRFIADKKQELARIEVVLETAEKDAAERFQLQGTDLPETALDEPSERTRLEQENRRLQKQIDELGSVNELALQEYESVEDRRQFLLTQRKDCEDSVVQLQDMIATIENETKERFAETYTQVNQAFQKLFPVLFPGGHAELVLLSPQDMLTTGVEIQARLPGKKTQNMNLFSGGEKALTAISLIFALLKTKPAPFCFLDEVDAPLDEANVGRFNDILNALCDQFQFVVITHNRRTMEILDTIYGISMVEPGVSKLVSVDLSQLPDHLRKKPKAALAPKPAAASALPDVGGAERRGASIS